jgi:hypothetical protein
VQTFFFSFFFSQLSDKHHYTSCIITCYRSRCNKIDHLHISDLILKLYVFTHIYRSYLSFYCEGPSWSWSYGSWIYNYICNQCLSPLTLWVRILGITVSSTNKTDRHDITEILLKVALNTITLANSNPFIVDKRVLFHVKFI